MDGVEDPSNLSKEDLIYLQANVGKLSIIPDKIMRPASKSINYFDDRMGIISIFIPIVWVLLLRSMKFQRL